MSRVAETIGEIVVVIVVVAVGTGIVMSDVGEKRSQSPEPQVIERPVPVKIYIEKPVPYEVTRYEMVYVDKPITVFEPQRCRNFASLAELEKWLAKDTTDMVFLRADESGVCRDICPQDYDCDKYAMTLQANAYRDGFYLSIYVTEDKDHALNLAVVGGSVYLVEPQTDDVDEFCPLD